MKALVFVIAMLAAPIAFATAQQYQLDSKVFVNGKLISSPRLTTNANESAEITQHSDIPISDLRMKVIASDMTNENVKNGILMKFDVSYLVNGRTIKSTPQILAKAGEPATIEVGDKGSTMKIEVTATRI